MILPATVSTEWKAAELVMEGDDPSLATVSTEGHPGTAAIALKSCMQH